MDEASHQDDKQGGRWASWKEREPELAEMPKEIRTKVSISLEVDEEGQGSQLLRELAKTELQAAVGSHLVERLTTRLADIALESPGNLRLTRTLLNARSLDELITDGPQAGWPSDPILEIDPEDENGESWILEGADEQHTIMELWCLLVEAEHLTRSERAGAEAGIRVWSAGREPAVKEIEKRFTWLEVYLGSYKIEHQVEGVRRLTEQIVRSENDPEE
jgi:hypothetical protein